MIFSAILLLALGAARLMPMTAGASRIQFDGFAAPAWAVLLGLALISAATAYLTGIGAARRLGARLASLCALMEVVAAIVWAAALLGQIPAPMQIVGGVLIIAGVVAAKMGEKDATAPIPDAVPLDGLPDRVGRD